MPVRLFRYTTQRSFNNRCAFDQEQIGILFTPSQSTFSQPGTAIPPAEGKEDRSMITTRTLLATALFGCLFTGVAQAGTCPADKVVAEGKGQQMSSAPASGVTDT